jgi:hypothetical protein
MTSLAAKLHGVWATGHYGITSSDPLGLLGSKGRKTEGGGCRGEVVAGVRAATSARRRCWCPFQVRRRANACARACAGVRVRSVKDTARPGVGRKKGRRGGRRGGARAGAMGGGGQGDRGRCKCAWEKLRTVTRRALGDQESGAPFPVSTCAKHPTTARPWQRGRPKRGGEARRKKKGQQVQPRLWVGVHACWGARWRESVVPTRTRA